MDGRVFVYSGDCLDVLKEIPENSIDSCVCDPPYHFASIVERFGADDAAPAKSHGATGVYKRASAGFMGQQWDGGDIAFQPSTWEAVLRVLKPGAHLLAFGAPKNAHRLFCAIEDAGFEIRDTIMWLFGTGFPKSHNTSKAIDKSLGAKREVVGVYQRGLAMHPGNEGVDNWRDNYTGVVEVTIPGTEEALQWEGWGTALKPAYEPIVLARKPLSEPTIAANVLRWGTGALNIDGCRVGTGDDKGDWPITNRATERGSMAGPMSAAITDTTKGRWPANVLHDGSEEVVAAFPETSSALRGGYENNRDAKVYGTFVNSPTGIGNTYADSGSAARFFYTAKADADDRLGSKHPTVKPLDLMQYLVRLVTPPGGTVLDCFAGTGTTGEAAWRERFNAVLIERDETYLDDIERRMKLCLSGRDERRRESIKAKNRGKPVDLGPLFGDLNG